MDFRPDEDSSDDEEDAIEEGGADAEEEDAASSSSSEEEEEKQPKSAPPRKRVVGAVPADERREAKERASVELVAVVLSVVGDGCVLVVSRPAWRSQSKRLGEWHNVHLRLFDHVSTTCDTGGGCKGGGGCCECG